MDFFWEMGGAYILYFEIKGNLFIQKPYEETLTGPLVYVGSAMGKAGFKRVLRHLSFNKTKRVTWHIDQILRETLPESVYLFPSKERFECKLSGIIWSRFPVAVEGFGSTDCQCDSHLYTVNMYDLEMLLSEKGVPFIKLCVNKRNNSHGK